MSRILIEHATIVVDATAIPFEGFIIVEGERIAQIGSGDCSADHSSFDCVIDATNKVVMPGLVNTHGHAAMVLLRSFADDLPLMDWLQGKIWPVEARMSSDDIYWGTQLAIAEMLLSGTTCFTDMYFHVNAVAEAVEQTGIRAILGRGLVGLDPRADVMLDEGVAFFNQWNGAADGRITATLAPHAPYTCPPEYLRRVVKESERIDADLQIHVSETRGEVEDCVRQFGMTPVRLLEQEGVFERPTIAAHCVHIDDAEIDILAARNIRVAHNPISNLKLASGIAPLPRLLDRGITVGLGTDGAASNNRLDIFTEMRLAALIHKGVTENPTAVPAATAFHLATKGGADVLLPQKLLGILQENALADIIIVDFDKAHLWPRHDVMAHLVYAAQSGDVTHVLVNGKLVVDDRVLTMMDMERIKAEVNGATKRLFG